MAANEQFRVKYRVVHRLGCEHFSYKEQTRQEVQHMLRQQEMPVKSKMSHFGKHHKLPMAEQGVMVFILLKR